VRGLERPEPAPDVALDGGPRTRLLLEALWRVAAGRARARPCSCKPRRTPPPTAIAARRQVVASLDLEPPDRRAARLNALVVQWPGDTRRASWPHLAMLLDSLRKAGLGSW